MTTRTRSIVGRLSGGASMTASLLVAAPSAYLAVITVAGGRRRAAPPSRTGSRDTRFVVLVPAHDEAAGIGATLESLAAVDYPGDRFAVHVVADNCTDTTAEIVRAHGMTAHERDDLDHPGKGAALNWLFDRLAAAGDEFDAVVIVDADTSVDRRFLAAMDRELSDGVEVAQGFYSVRDPEASAATSFRYAALACRHHVRAAGRCRIGASCGLYGNGMVFGRHILDSRRWSGHLVEDAEFQNELLLDGIRVRYVPDAVVRAEMPTTTAAATTQNQRWERGRLQLARRFVPDHIRRVVRGPRRVAHADAVADHLVPPLSALVGFQIVATAVGALFAAPGRRSTRSVAIGVTALAVVVGHTLTGLRSIGAERRHYISLLQAPKMIVWKIAILTRAAMPNADVAWTRTQRNESAP